MNSKGFIKRFLPFFLTFAAGLFIASVFVPITGPFAGFQNRGMRNKCREVQELRMDVQELRNERIRLQNEIDEMRRQASNWEDGLTYPAPVPMGVDEPLPPPPLKAPRPPRR